MKKLFFLFLLSSTAYASSESEIKLLKQQLALLQERIQNLETQSSRQSEIWRRTAGASHSAQKNLGSKFAKNVCRAKPNSGLTTRGIKYPEGIDEALAIKKGGGSFGTLDVSGTSCSEQNILGSESATNIWRTTGNDDYIEFHEEKAKFIHKKIARLIKNKKYWNIPNTETFVGIEGFFKLTGICDIKGSTALLGDATGAGQNYFTARSIGLNGLQNPNSKDFHLSARETRFSIQSLSMLENQLLRMLIEIDFLGDPTGNALVANNYNPRLRKAFLDYKNFRVGQDWSFFADLSAFPENIDRNGPAGNCQIRQPLIGYTYKIDNFDIFFSLENPESEFITRNGTKANSGSALSQAPYIENIKGKNNMPDFVLGTTFKGDFGHIRIAGLFRNNAIYDSLENRTVNKCGYGINLSWRLKMFSNDSFYGHFNYGAGLGRYLTETLKSATYYDGEKLHNERAVQGSFGYTHLWTKHHKIRSSLAVGFLRELHSKALKNNLRDGIILNPLNINKYMASLHANLIGNINDQLQIGIEYILGRRKIELNQSGVLNRISFAIQLNF